MNKRTRIIIVDDNKAFCESLSKFLKKYDDIEILEIGNTDQAEINMIENLNPEIVITDLMRNRRYTGLDIIKKYLKYKEHPQFLVISADRKEDVIKEDLELSGYIKKPIEDYNIVIQELRKIKEKITTY